MVEVALANRSVDGDALSVVGSEGQCLDEGVGSSLIVLLLALKLALHDQCAIVVRILAQSSLDNLVGLGLLADVAQRGDEQGEDADVLGILSELLLQLVGVAHGVLMGLELCAEDSQLQLLCVLAALRALDGVLHITLGLGPILVLVGIVGGVVGDVTEVLVLADVELGEHRPLCGLHILGKILVGVGIIVGILEEHTTVDEQAAHHVELVGKTGILVLHLALGIGKSVILHTLLCIGEGIADCLVGLCALLACCLVSLHGLQGELSQVVVGGCLLGVVGQLIETLAQQLGCLGVGLGLQDSLEHVAVASEGCR